MGPSTLTQGWPLGLAGLPRGWEGPLGLAGLAGLLLLLVLGRAVLVPGAGWERPPFWGAHLLGGLQGDLPSPFIASGLCILPRTAHLQGLPVFTQLSRRAVF